MQVSILGCGWFGLPLAIHLVERGHIVMGSSATLSKLEEMRMRQIEPFFIKFPSTDLTNTRFNHFFSSEILVITLPPRLGDAQMNVYRQLIDLSKANGIKRIIYISSTGVYGSPNAFVDEHSPVAPLTQSASMVMEIENILRSPPLLPTTCIRFGGLVGPGRSPANFIRADKRHSDGLAPVNLIHLDDCLAITTKFIEVSHTNLIINAVSPHHPTRMAFYKAAARASNKPIPFFIEELGSWKVVDSRYLTPLLDYKFIVGNWFDWLDQRRPDLC